MRHDEDPLQSYSVPQTAKLLGKGQSSVKTLIRKRRVVRVCLE